jgi:DNA polymerase eta
MMQSRSKAIILVDMDCFYVQVEKKLHPELHGKPCCIVQYNAWKGGSIIAVDYEARKYGISRNLKGDDAKEKCPDVQLVKVPEKRGKADLTNYRRASSEVMKVLSEFTPIIERASIDEAYLDITERVKEYLARTAESIDTSGLASTCIAGQNERDLLSSVEENDEVDHLNSGTDDIIKERLREMATEDPMLVVGAIITQTIREAVYNQTSFTCSAGISYNKMLAKLAAGMNKPNKQTILPLSNVTNLFMSTPFKKVLVNNISILLCDVVLNIIII